MGVTGSGEPTTGKTTKIADMLKRMVSKRASDIHMHAGSQPHIRVDGSLIAFEGMPKLTPQMTEQIALAMMSETQRDLFEHRHELDFAFNIPDIARFRCNIFRQRGSVGIAMRIVNASVPTFESLGLPAPLLKQFCDQARGLVLVTGPTGSGKSTTLGSMVDYINQKYPRNIITIEDPIEILHHNQRSLVVQREVGLDTGSFIDALKYAMRQDPDVIMIGEMRDKETVEAAITAAQTGHLVLSTLHTLDAVRTVNRIIDFFPPHERDQIRILLSESLLGLVSQRLMRRAVGEGRVLALEVMINTPLIRDYIKDEDKTSLIKEAMMEGREIGMQTFDQHLVDLYLSEEISWEEAEMISTSPHEFRLMVTQRKGWKQPKASESRQDDDEDFPFRKPRPGGRPR